MNNKKETSFNGQVFQKTYKRINLSPSQRIVYQRLLGFLIRNDKPFPYSAVKLSELTGYDKRTIFRCLDRLEECRLIIRTGMGKNRRFQRGSILNKILTTVTNRSKLKLVNNKTTATPCHQNLTNRDIVSYKKTSSSLKPKKDKFFFDKDYHDYISDIRCKKRLGLMDKNFREMNYTEWSVFGFESENAA